MDVQLALAPAPLALLLIGASIALGAWAYATRYPVLSGRRRAVLLGARLLALLALLVAALAPILRYPTTSRERNRLLVLVDHSGSMDVRDAAGGRSRAQAADSAAGRIARDLGRRYDVRVAPFDAVLGPFARGAGALDAARDAGGRRAGETAVGDALREAFARNDPDSVAAILVLSDGANNRGDDPEQALDPAVPAFALVAGTAKDPPTVGISGVEAPAEAVLGRPATLYASLRQGALSVSRGTVRLAEGGRQIARAPFELRGRGAAARVPLTFTPGAPGRRFLWLSLDPIAGDPMRENKGRLVAIDVRPARRVVPVLASRWDWDLRSLVRGVEADTGWSVTRLSPSGGAAAAPHGGTSAPFESFLDDAETVVARLDARSLTPERAQALLRYATRGGGLLLWTDPQGEGPPDVPLTRAMGLTWRFFGREPGAGAAADLTAAGRAHEVALLGHDAASAGALWRDLPPVKPPMFLGARGSVLAPLLATKLDQMDVPLLLAGRLGAGRVAVLNAAGVYRWGLTASGLGNAAGVENAFFGGLVRWLGAADEDRPVHVAAPDITPEGRAIAVRVTTTAPAGPEARASVTARRVARTGAFGESDAPRGAVPLPASATLASVEPGVYTGSVAAAPGVYVLVGKLERGGRLIGADSLRVAVGGQGVEYETLAAEPDVLARLAERSGGAAAPLERPDPVLRRLQSADLVRRRLAQVDLFHNPLLFAVLVLGLALEWSLRRRFHLI